MTAITATQMAALERDFPDRAERIQALRAEKAKIDNKTHIWKSLFIGSLVLVGLGLAFGIIFGVIVIGTNNNNNTILDNTRHRVDTLNGTITNQSILLQQQYYTEGQQTKTINALTAQLQQNGIAPIISSVPSVTLPSQRAVPSPEVASPDLGRLDSPIMPVPRR